MMDARIRNRQSNFGTGNQRVEAIKAALPAATITQR